MEDQVMKIIGLEEVAVLRLRKACTYEEAAVMTSGSRSQKC